MHIKHHFFGLLSRMRLIKRWSLMRNMQPENITEHSFDVALIAHNLAWLRRLQFNQDRVLPDPNYVLALALFHDVSEIITGDLPTPVKYYDPNIRQAFANLETKANQRLISLLPPNLKAVYRDLLEPDTSDELTAAACQLVKAADKISAYLKCLQETDQGNKEFLPALEQTARIIVDLKLPEVDYFMDTFAPSYTLALDELKPELGDEE